MHMTSANSPEALGAAVMAARRRLGLTPPQLALAAGVGVRFMVELESGKPTVRLETLLKVLLVPGGTTSLSQSLPLRPEVDGGFGRKPAKNHESVFSR